MTIEDIKLIIPQLASHKASTEIIDAFENWLSEANKEEVAEISDLYYQILNTIPPFNDSDLLSIINKIELKLDESESLVNETASVSRVTKFLAIRSWASVAAILLLVIGTGYIFRNQLGFNNSIAPVTERYKNDVAPGSNKAILTLGNGQSVALNGLRDGTINNEEGSIINKKGNEIDYQHNDNTETKEVVTYNTVSTPCGGQFCLALADGSKVWLNASSSIHFPVAFTTNTREVNLTGEAYFEVAKNAAKPFIVHVNDMDVKVLGTHFNVMAYNDEAVIKTTLLEGSVKLTKGTATELLVPGKLASLKLQMFTVTDADINKELAWKNGSFVFNKEGIETIMRQMARWYNIEVSYEGAAPANAFVGEIRRDATLAESLKILELGGVHFKIQGNRVIVMEK